MLRTTVLTASLLIAATLGPRVASACIVADDTPEAGECSFYPQICVSRFDEEAGWYQACDPDPRYCVGRWNEELGSFVDCQGGGSTTCGDDVCTDGETCGRCSECCGGYPACGWIRDLSYNGWDHGVNGCGWSNETTFVDLLGNTRRAIEVHGPPGPDGWCTVQVEGFISSCR